MKLKNLVSDGDYRLPKPVGIVQVRRGKLKRRQGIYEKPNGETGFGAVTYSAEYEISQVWNGLSWESPDARKSGDFRVSKHDYDSCGNRVNRR